MTYNTKLELGMLIKLNKKIINIIHKDSTYKYI